MLLLEKRRWWGAGTVRYRHTRSLQSRLSFNLSLRDQNNAYFYCGRSATEISEFVEGFWFFGPLVAGAWP